MKTFEDDEKTKFVHIYCNTLNNLIIIPCGESSKSKLKRVHIEIDAVSKVNYPYDENELEETLFRSMELCHSKEPDVESKQSIIERELGISGYNKATKKLVRKKLKRILFQWNNIEGYSIRPLCRGYLEKHIILLGKNIEQGQLAEAVKKTINLKQKWFLNK
ncbi:hypothetical protein [Neobacillus bataviensis]|uniref:hypothetical protein n=1 Tax=Neobacillus bataviensis TaxID=220685 RepID=UPI001CBB8C27|nr:hypothetical protein [Neobacillus bataviensis]